MKNHKWNNPTVFDVFSSSLHAIFILLPSSCFFLHAILCLLAPWAGHFPQRCDFLACCECKTVEDIHCGGSIINENIATLCVLYRGRCCFVSLLTGAVSDDFWKSHSLTHIDLVRMWEKGSEGILRKRLNMRGTDKTGRENESTGNEKIARQVIESRYWVLCVQAPVNEHSVSFCRQFYASQWLLDGLHLTFFHTSYCGRCSAAADANTVVTLLSPPINCFPLYRPLQS